MKNLDLSKIIKNLKKYLAPFKFILKHHYFVTVLVILVILISAVMSVNSTLQEPSDEAYRAEKASSGISSRFDEDTIKRIEKLQRSSDTPGSEETLPTNSRINPFSE